MSKFETAAKYFHACESLQGWWGCKGYVAGGARFSAQSEPLIDIGTIEEYCEWMAGLGRGPLKGCSYELHCSAYDEANRSAIFFATFRGTHEGEGGPVEPTQQQTNSEYVYVVGMNEKGKVANMCKIWNAPWALAELGWA